MAEARRKFDQDFREGAVRLVRETGKPIAQVARDLGINEGTLGNWVNADRRRRGDGTGVLDEDERTELARARKENAELAMERDVLKHSVANRTIELPMTRRLLAVVVLIGLICSGIIAYSTYQISSAQGHVAIAQHHDQQANEFLVISLQQGLLRHLQKSDYFYKGAMKLFTLNGPLITHYEDVEAEYSTANHIYCLFGALLGWGINGMLRAGHRKA